MERKRFVDWSFGHYLEIAHPRFVGERSKVAGASPAASDVSALYGQNARSRHLADSQSRPDPSVNRERRIHLERRGHLPACDLLDLLGLPASGPSKSSSS